MKSARFARTLRVSPDPSKLRIDRGKPLCRLRLLPFRKEETECRGKREEYFSHEEERGRIEIVEENSSPGQSDGWDHFNGQKPLRRSTVSVRFNILLNYFFPKRDLLLPADQPRRTKISLTILIFKRFFPRSAQKKRYIYIKKEFLL
jgi:hypothetical protein